jgi:hypothetical protein
MKARFDDHVITVRAVALPTGTSCLRDARIGSMARPMRRSDIEDLAASIRAVLADPDAGINELQCRRWEGALVALEAVLGEKISLVDNLEMDLL